MTLADKMSSVLFALFFGGYEQVAHRINSSGVGWSEENPIDSTHSFCEISKYSTKKKVIKNERMLARKITGTLHQKSVSSLQPECVQHIVDTRAMHSFKGMAYLNEINTFI